jgi:hypothetical protein
VRVAIAKLIVELAERHRVPAIHALRNATADGAMMSYGVDLPELFRQAPSYVDYILRGERPANLPVQQPTKFELIMNLKTAKTLGLEVPPSLLARADEVLALRCRPRCPLPCRQIRDKRTRYALLAGLFASGEAKGGGTSGPKRSCIT